MQQMGLFDVTDSSECNTIKADYGDTTLTKFLARSAAICCDSKIVDQTVCKADRCASGMVFCSASHKGYFEDVAKNITNPKAMEANGRGELQGDCGLAILNGVEGEICCGAMRQLTTCVSTEVGDYTQCREIWNNMFEPNFFNKTDAAMKAFETGGYCVSPHARTTQTQSETKMINRRPCPAENIVIVNQGCDKYTSDYYYQDYEGMVCANDGQHDEAYCSFEVGDTACAYCKATCPTCGVNSKTGKLSCCFQGGTWFKKCGSAPNFIHSWEEGTMACTRKCVDC